ncbi:MAG: hypothetical protein V7784_02855 [Oceanospirillaceae bacterium]
MQNHDKKIEDADRILQLAISRFKASQEKLEKLQVAIIEEEKILKAANDEILAATTAFFDLKEMENPIT